MRKITERELRVVQDILDFIKPVVSLEMVYLDSQNILMLGDNYLIRGLTKHNREVETPAFILTYGSDHPGDDHFDLDRWEEEDIAVAASVESLMPIFVANLMTRLVEEKVYSRIRFDSPMITGKVE
jgi:hypothetical protein